jgi:hypothetical protein
MTTEIPMPKTMHLNYELSDWYTPRGLYERLMQTVLKADSRIARVVTERSDRGAFDHMELLYAGEYSPDGILGGMLDKKFMNSRGGRSIKTRTDFAAELIYKYGAQMADMNGGKVNIMSLGSGAAREIIYPLQKLNVDSIEAYATCVDLNSEANKYSSMLAEEAGVRENITYREDDILNIRRFPDEPEDPEQFDIMSIVGMFEYFTPEDAEIWLKHHVNERISPGGILIGTNMKKHDFDIMLAMNATGWKLVYKEPEEFSRIVSDSGLSVVEELYEPETEVHRFVVGQKPIDD